MYAMNRKPSGSRPAIPAQRGAVLFVALIFLVLMTLLAVVASNTSIMQERMTGGMRNVQVAQLGADSAVRGMEFQIWSSVGRTNLVCNGTGGPSAAFRCYQRFVDPTFSPTGGEQVGLDSRVRAFRNAKGKLDTATDGASPAPLDFSATSIPESARLAQRPRVLVEMLGKVAVGNAAKAPHGGLKPVAAGPGGGVQDFYSYRITARSTGGNDSAVRLAESVFLAQTQSISTP